MKTQTVKTVNYSQDVVNAIVDEYTKSVLIDGSNNSEVLDNLSKKYGKSVHSLRAKLAQLKVYVKVTDNVPVAKSKKEDLLNDLEKLVGEELPSLASATKRDLQFLIGALNTD